jgi:transcriptional regulator with XRE-family HTH domain
MEDTLSSAVKRLRAALGDVSQETLAHQIGTTVRTVARWEKGDAIPAEALARLRQAAVEISDLELVNTFQAAILVRLHLNYQFDDCIPQTAVEMLLVGEFLRRFRRNDSAVTPIVGQLLQWLAEQPQYKVRTLADWMKGEGLLKPRLTLKDLMSGRKDKE